MVRLLLFFRENVFASVATRKKEAKQKSTIEKSEQQVIGFTSSGFDSGTFFYFVVSSYACVSACLSVCFGAPHFRQTSATDVR